MTFTLPPLPYEKTALEPFISAQTFDFHHGKHHQAYVTNLNNLLEGGHPLKGESLETIMKKTAGKADMQGIFNNAAQVWNHTFFWNSMKKDAAMPANVKAELEKAFGSVDEFKVQFKQAAITQFGSGWAWLVRDAGGLKIVKTANADCPLVHGQKPILTCDVWEHAYYLDYQNRRPDFVQTFLDHLVNWEFASQNMA